MRGSVPGRTTVPVDALVPGFAGHVSGQSCQLVLSGINHRRGITCLPEAVLTSDLLLATIQGADSEF